MAVPGPRVGDCPAGRLRGSPHPRRFIHRRARWDRTRFRSCSTCAGTGACRCAGPRPATPPTSVVPTTPGRIATRASCVGVPFHLDAYGGEAGLNRAETRLVSAPRVATHRGLIFAIPRSRRAGHRRLPWAASRFFLDFYVNQSEDGDRGSGTAALAGQLQLEDRSRELRRRLVPHAPHPRQRGRDRVVPGAEGIQAQGRSAVLLRGRRGHHLQAADQGLRREPGIHRIPAGDGRANARPVEPGAAGDDRGRRIHGLGGHPFPKSEPGAQLAPGARGRPRRPVHLAAALAAAGTDRDRGLLVVRGRPQRAGLVQARLLQGVPDVLRIIRDVRAGRRRELDVDHLGRPGPPGGPGRAVSTMGMAPAGAPSRIPSPAGRARDRRSSGTGSTTSGRCSGSGAAIWTERGERR